MPGSIKKDRALRRIIEAIYEIGVLLFAFAPLDYTLDPRPFSATWPLVAGFVFFGAVLIVFCVVVEWRYFDG